MAVVRSILWNAALLLASLILTISQAKLECQNTVSCRCGSTSENITICTDAGEEVCTRLSKCKSCLEGSDVCSECPEGLNGPLCSQEIVKVCENPGPISNGKVRLYNPFPNGGSDHVHTIAEYSCDNGYILFGPQTKTCNAAGDWSGLGPACIRDNTNFCTNPRFMSNGKIQFFHPTLQVGPETKVPQDTILELSCNEGYRLDGRSSSTCNTYWSPRLNQIKCKTDCGRGFYNSGPCTMLNCNKHTPWLVTISVEDENGFNQVCLGSLINHETILTAAHCLTSATNFTIHFGKHKFGDDNTTDVIVRKSSRTILHPDFSKTTFDSNIGLLFFQPRIRFTDDVQPICLWDRSPVVGTGIVSVTGGLHKDDTEDDTMLARMTVLSDEECLEANKQANLFITQNSFCAGNKDERHIVCAQDGGAPLFFYDKDTGRFMLTGVASYGTRKRHHCGLQGNYALFTKISWFVEWIERNLSIFD